MQEDKFKDFDRQIRSMVEDAGQEAPAGVWEAVSARLDAMEAAAAAPAAQAARRHSRAWGWAAASLAAAAALAVGIFVNLPSYDNSDLTTITASVPAVSDANAGDLSSGSGMPGTADLTAMVNAQPDASVPAASAKTQAGGSMPAATANAPAGDVKARPNGAAARGAAAGELADNSLKDSELTTSLPSENKGENLAQNADNQEIERHDAPQASASGAPAVADPVAEPTPVADPFALLAYEDAGRQPAKVRFSGVLIGGISSNNASAASVSKGAGSSYVQSGITELTKSDYGIPFSAGLGLRVHLGDRFSFGVGADYSLLTRTFSGIYNGDGILKIVNSDISHTMQYVGIPVDVFYTLVNTRDVNFYANLGGEAEFAVSNKYKILKTDQVLSTKVENVQWSVGAGLGVEFSLGGPVGLYVEPGVRYYFDCNQPKNVRTDKPFQFLMRAGLRFDF